MSDLRARARDQEAGPNTRTEPGNRLRRDRGPRVSDLVSVLCALVAGCAHPPIPATHAEVHPVEVWVDAFSAAGGDGSSAHPLKTIPAPVPAGVSLHLRSGLYPGPFVLGAGVHLEGHGEVVLTGEAGQTVVTATGATLVGLSVQGGAIGLVAEGPVVATRLHFSGQRAQAAVVRGQLTLTDSTLEASVEGIDGVRVEPEGTLIASGVKLQGGFKRGVVSEGGSLELRRLSSEGVKTLVHAIGGKSVLDDVRAARGSGAALFFSGGTVSVTGAEVTGHDYAVLLFRGTDATISRLRATATALACVSAIGSKLHLSDSSLTGCGPAGAVTLQQAQTTLTRLEITSARELGVFVKNGTLRLEGVRISKVASAPDDSLGDALHVRDEAVVTGTGELTFSDLGGTGLFASTYSKVRLPSLTVERARSSALFVELYAELKLDSLLVRGGSGPALVVSEHATTQVGSLSVAGGNELPVFADCQTGAQVTIGRLESTVQQLSSRCVTLPAAKD